LNSKAYELGRHPGQLIGLFLCDPYHHLQTLAGARPGEQPLTE